jgi:hypothetical protein
MVTARDREQLSGLGIAPEEVERQLALLKRGPRYVRVVRPCTVGDGIERLHAAHHAELLEHHAAAARAGRCSKFVPASGAATRMFRELLWFQRGAGRELSWPEIQRQASEGRAEARALVEFLSRLAELPFHDQLRRTLFRRGEELNGLARVGAFQPVLDALLASDGMDYAALPKGLLAFHVTAEGIPRTPLEEHLLEAVDYVRDAWETCRLHFTVSPEHRAGFERLFDEVGPDLELRSGAKLRVSWSVQEPSTATVAAEVSGEPARDRDGRLLLRPGGHGALLGNLERLHGDVVFIKNVDNVQPEGSRATTVEWKKLLGGVLVRAQGEAANHLERLREARVEPAAIDEAERWVAQRLQLELDGPGGSAALEARRARLLDRLNRPLRVGGVVRNTGEPGGGPFWVEHADGSTSLQIVEGAQIDPEEAGQREIFAASTHFNPVDLVCGLRDAEGRPFTLETFVDQEAVIITRKSEGGRDLRVLERPGLWNGGMARWNTIFVEVPNETFTPVKSVLDLLRPEHR